MRIRNETVEFNSRRSSERFSYDHAGLVGCRIGTQLHLESILSRGGQDHQLAEQENLFSKLGGTIGTLPIPGGKGITAETFNDISIVNTGMAIPGPF
jgi:hypothetical protein